MRGARRSSLAAVLAVALAFGAMPFVPGRAAATTDYTANCSANLRSSASTGGTLLASLSAGTIVTATGTVSGGSWSASCPASVSGSTWLAITEVNSKSVSSLYGVSVAYAASGLFSSLAGTYLNGVDVSVWQGTVDFSQVKAAGMRFVIAKATEGIGYADAQYQANRTNARAAGLAFTGYHYARPDLNPTNAKGEADWFVQNLGLVAGFLPPALDLEVHGTLSTSQLQNWVSTWVGEVYTLTGVRPMIYTSPSFWSTYMGNTTAYADAGYTVLWIAHWFVSKPTVPANNWGGHGWTFWQYDDCGAVPGISGCVDMDRYNGTDLTPVTYGADFSVTTSPISRSVKQGSGTSYTVNLARAYFTLPIDLSVSGAPPGATASISPTSTSGSSATLSVTTSVSGTVTPVGTYPLTVTGTSNGVTHTTTATLTVTDSIPPTVKATMPRLYLGTTMGSTTSPVSVSWSATDPSGIASYTLLRWVNGGAWTAQTLPSPTSTSLVQSLTFGSTYRYTVKATDGAGNTSGWAYGPIFEPLLTEQNGNGTSYSGSWATSFSSYASGGSLAYTSTAGASASFTFAGASVSWVAYRGPNRGSAAIYLDGVYYGTVSLYASSYYSKPIAYAANWGANGTHTIKIVCLGTSGHPRIDVDAFVRLYDL